MGKTVIRVGPADHGKRMSLKDFDHAEVQEGHLYELSRGIVTVSDVPKPKHLFQVEAMRRQLYSYDAAHPGTIYFVASGNECKLLVWDLESERHPDLAVYTTPPPKKDVWTTWIPQLVIEVVSPGSRRRDYEEKPEEYLRFKVPEYWVVDAKKGEVLVHRRRGSRWVKRVVRPPERYRTPLLPGFELDCAAIFQAAETAGG
jgi:hypothetical protein